MHYNRKYHLFGFNYSTLNYFTTIVVGTIENYTYGKVSLYK